MSVLKLVTLNPPSFDITTDASGNLGTKRAFFLRNAALRYGGIIPADAEIVRTWIVCEQMEDFPAGCYGDVTWGIYSRLYEKLSGVPLRERCQPMGTALFGRLLLRPGADTESFRDHPGIPYIDERLGVFFQVAKAPSRKFCLFSAVMMRSATGFIELPGIVYHDVPNRSVSGQQAHSFRNTFSDIPEGGSEIRVTVQGLDAGMSLSHMSVGVRDGGAGFTMKADPVPVTFDGQAGLNLPEHTFRQSDWAPLPEPIEPGAAILVHSCVGDRWACKDVSTEDENPGCYVAGTSGHDVRAFSGTVQVVDGYGNPNPNGTHHRKHVVAMIEVR